MITPMDCLAVFAGLWLLANSGQALTLPADQVVLGSNNDDASEIAKKIQKELKEAEIIPTVIDDFTPSLTLQAEWSSDNSALLGNTLKPKKLQDAPSISLYDPSGGNEFCTRSGKTYVVTLTDPDAPSRDNPKWSEMCHWIAAGHGVSTSSSTPTSTGDCLFAEPLALTELEEIMPYKAPGPPEKTGKHRYVFFAFAAENGTTDKLHPSKPKDRQHWGYDAPGKDGQTHGVRDWAKENGLVPVAANFIYSKNKKQ
ncbi:phosphatidylethanolamine-binding protein [Podospora appendiculata]|uniref:Phosphatidylethanolamine-binding protein n=1 Tax=Podospora appendiculata TaxID=314037 RepID=A0AAE0X4Q9_9PEZI|nr:phosphatidylethanolamine-binding protein [Podospora appendiculata]